MVWDFVKELQRKAIHLLAIFFIVVFVLVSNRFGKNLALFVLVFFLILFLEIDYFRVELKTKIPVLWRLWRKKEKDRFGGQVFFLLGALISLSIFDYKIALTAILMTVFGDMAAALIGKRFGRTWITKDRALEGILAEFIVDFTIAILILDSWPVIIVMALTATFVETIIHKLDDNLVIPLFAGFNGEIIKYLVNLIERW